MLAGPLVLENPARYRAALIALLTPNQVEPDATLAQAESSQLYAQTAALTAAATRTPAYDTCVPLANRVESAAPEQMAAVEGSFAPAAAYGTETLDMFWRAGGRSSSRPSCWTRGGR